MVDGNQEIQRFYEQVDGFKGSLDSDSPNEISRQQERLSGIIDDGNDIYQGLIGEIDRPDRLPLELGDFKKYLDGLNGANDGAANLAQEIRALEASLGVGNPQSEDGSAVRSATAVPAAVAGRDSAVEGGEPEALSRSTQGVDGVIEDARESLSRPETPKDKAKSVVMEYIDGIEQENPKIMWIVELVLQALANDPSFGKFVGPVWNEYLETKKIPKETRQYFEDNPELTTNPPYSTIEQVKSGATCQFFTAKNCKDLRVSWKIWQEKKSPDGKSEPNKDSTYMDYLDYKLGNIDNSTGITIEQLTEDSAAIERVSNQERGEYKKAIEDYVNSKKLGEILALSEVKPSNDDVEKMKNSAREKASSTEGVDYNEQSFMTVLQSLGEKLPGAIIGPAIASKLGVQEAQIDSYNNSEIKLKELGAGNDITGKITKEEGGKWKIELKKGEEGETTNSVADSEIKGKIDELVSQLENNDATEAAAQASEAIDTSTPFGELLTPGEGQQDKAKAQIRRRLRIERNNNISINNGEVVVSGFSYSGSGAITPNVDYSIHIKQEDGVIKFWVKLDNGTEKDKISVNSNSINDFKTAFNQAKESVT